MRPNRRANTTFIEPLEQRRLLAAAGASTIIGAWVDSAAERVVVEGGQLGSFDIGEDIGNPAIAGSSSFSNGSYTIAAAGTDIAGVSDQFHFVHDPLTGDGTFTARVASLINTNVGAKAGIMMRSSTNADAAFAAVVLTPSSGVQFRVRLTDGDTSAASSIGGITAPRWVRLVKTGNNIAGFWSTDGITWNTVGSPQAIALGGSPRIGLAVTSRNVLTPTTAVFSNVSYLLPEGYAINDLGSPGVAGSAAFDPVTQAFEVTGGGTGVGGTGDQLAFLNRNLTGGGTVTALVDASAVGAGAASIMIRGAATGGAAFASVSLGAGSVRFDWRATAGASAAGVSIAAASATLWLRIVQTSSTVAAYTSQNGVAFTQIGQTQPLVMPSASAITGGAVASGSSGTAVSAIFSKFSVVPAGLDNLSVGTTTSPALIDFDSPSNTSIIRATGTGLAAAGDSLSFLSRGMAGDGSVVGYLNSFNGADPAARAGLMLRASTSVDAPFVAVAVVPAVGVRMIFRLTPGGPIAQQGSGGVLSAVSMRLIRSGSNVSASFSTDGVAFTPLGTAVGVALNNTALAGAFVASGDSVLSASASFTGIAAGRSLPPGAGIFSAADELFLHDLSRRSVDFFYTETNASTGQAPDGSNANGGSPSSASSIASTGFALSALVIAAERGFLSRADAYQRALNTVNFLNTTAAQVNGFFYHFINPVTGARSGNSELSPMDTALLMAGVIHAAQYWPGTPLAAVAGTVFNRVDWPWMQKPNGHFYGHWTPESGFAFGYGDFSEAALIYLLGLGSQTFPSTASSWNSWSRSPSISYNGFNFITAQTGALFTTQYPLGWFDLRGLSDAAGLNYHNNAATAALAQRRMAVDLSGTFPQYGLNNWGFTAADGQGGYTVFGGPPPTGNINGTVVPTAPGGSLAFIPRQAVDALQHMRSTYGSTVYKKYGFVDAFNPHNGWTSSIVLGIDVGMMLLAAENARSGLIWNTFNESAVARQAKARAFTSLKPELLSAVTRKNNPTLGNHDLAIPQSEVLLIDDRVAGPTQLVLSFGAAVVKGPSFAITTSSGSVLSSAAGGTTLTVNLSSAADAAYLDVTIADLRHANTSGTPASGSYSLRIGVLAGDANRSGAVNLDDFTILASNFGQTPGGFPQADFNFDGTVNLDDFTVLAAQFGKSLPAARVLDDAGTGGRAAVFGSVAVQLDSQRWWSDDDESELDLITA
ncbi:MAG TPA: glucoamylase family protein [Tepidisphaeraceae bacterium]|nr:glucoamylase family protein [Tepidisphaeraceae bacterium]